MARKKLNLFLERKDFQGILIWFLEPCYDQIEIAEKEGKVNISTYYLQLPVSS